MQMHNRYIVIYFIEVLNYYLNDIHEKKLFIIVNSTSKMKRIGNSDSIELPVILTLLHGYKVACNRGISYLQLYKLYFMVSVFVCNLISYNIRKCYKFVINLKSVQWSIKIKHTLRERNYCTDWF